MATESSIKLSIMPTYRSAILQAETTTLNKGCGYI